MAKDTYYFSHDYNARTDRKIKKLIVTHGYQGYGLFWAIIEDLYNNANALPTDYETIAHDLHSTTEIIKSIVNDFELFVIADDIFCSSSVQRRLDERNNKSIKAKESAKIGWELRKRNANALPTQNEGNAIKEIKGKERKVFIAPTAKQVADYFVGKGYTQESGIRAFNYYHDAEWKDSQGKKVINWKQKMQGVWFKPENKIPSQQSRFVM